MTAIPPPQPPRARHPDPCREHINFVVPPSLRQRLTQAAVDGGVTLGHLLREAITRYLWGGPLTPDQRAWTEAEARHRGTTPDAIIRACVQGYMPEPGTEAPAP